MIKDRTFWTSLKTAVNGAELQVGIVYSYLDGSGIELSEIWMHPKGKEPIPLLSKTILNWLQEEPALIAEIERELAREEAKGKKHA